LSAEKSDLSKQIFQNLGQDQFINQDQMCPLMEDWYHETNNLCPEFFDFSEQSAKEFQSKIENLDEWAPLKEHGTIMYYYFTESWVLKYTILRASTISDWSALKDSSTGLPLMEALINVDRVYMKERNTNPNIGRS
jgi:hypothetical protein